MKKLKLLFAILFMVAAIISCDKRNVELRIESIIEYEGTAILIPQEGNTSCEDLTGEYVFSSGRINFVNGTFDFSEANTLDWPEGIDPVTGWPNGLSVTVSSDGRYISFNYTSDHYCVGAVIAKGGNESNVYTYDPAVKFDENLSAPINSSLLPAALSNLTFCFVECEEEVMVLALKTWMRDASGRFWAVTGGEGRDIPNVLVLGYYPVFDNTVAKKIYKEGDFLSDPVGTITVSDYIDPIDEKRYLEITVTGDYSGIYFGESWLFLGSVAGFTNIQTNFNYLSFPYYDQTYSATRVFKIPYNDIVMM